MADTWTPPKYGSPCWMGIPTSDIARAHKFYKAVFDWTFKSSDKLPETRVRMFDFAPSVSLSGGLQSTPVPEVPSGLFQPGNGAAGGPCIYWLVKDLDETAAVIEKEGGKMRSDKIKEGESGLYRFFEDSEGNVWAIYQFMG